MGIQMKEKTGVSEVKITLYNSANEEMEQILQIVMVNMSSVT